MTDELKPYAVTVSFFDKHSGRMGIAWQTKAKGQPALWYTDPEDTLFERASVLDANVSDGAAFDTVCFKNCALTPDFESGTDILYRVGDKSGVFSDPSILHIPKDDADRCAFAVFTDTQDTDTVGKWWEAALRDADEVFPQYGFIAHCGDIVETSVSFENWSKMLGNTAKHTRAYPLAAAPGNHDYWKWYLRDIVGSFYSHFNVSLPPQNTDYGAYCSVERGNMLILVLSTGDTNLTGGTLGKEQYEWAKKELSESRMNWKTVLIHKPLFSPGKYGSRVPNNDHCLKLRAQLCPLFSDCGVDLVIGTHPHVTEPVEKIEKDGHTMVVYYSIGNFVNSTAQTGAGIADRMVGAMADVTVERGDDGKVYISDYGVIPLVTHLSSGFGGITTYKLSDYTEDMAKNNLIVNSDPSFSLKYCTDLTNSVFPGLVK